MVFSVWVFVCLFVFYYFGGREERENFNKVLMAVGLFSDSKAEQLCQSVRRYTQV